ncbi:MAG TPA: hypothetical protein ENH65_14900 [Candidatus Aminicenantes bacterium]|nr:hypothetical protein [Candidatus Aminicenantes bacterium]
MGKEGSKTLMEKWRGFKQNNPNFRVYLLNWYFPAVVLTVLMVFLFSNLKNPELIKKEMLFWFFASCSQSMAALFAVVGMFAVFRYQDMQTRLRNLYDVLKKKFSSEKWVSFFGEADADYWEDSMVIEMSKEKLKGKESESPHATYSNLDVSIKIIESHESLRDYIRIFAKTPMIAIMITFMLSIVSLLFTKAYFSLFFLNYLGLTILCLTLGSITFSMLSVFRYFIISIPPR